MKHDTGAAVTPSLWLDLDRLDANIRRMHGHLHGLGVSIRPHLKTCKSIDVARLLLAAGAGSFTVSTLAEARYFFRHGITDQLYAVGIAPGKLQACAELVDQGLRLTITLDSVAAAQAVAVAAARWSCSYRVLLEIDCDGERAGFAADAQELLDAASILEQAGCQLAGVMTHAGGSYHCRDRECLQRAADNEREQTVAAAEHLRTGGFAAPVVSIGSTPTAAFARDLAGVTEVRPGTYVFQDLVMAGLGVCTIHAIAISVLCEVIGHRPEQCEVIVDAGWMALSRDRGTAAQPIDYGYGLVCDEQGKELDQLIVSHTNQEHGVIRRMDGAPIRLQEFPLGRRLRILPNHACATAAQHGGYQLLRDGRGIDEFWPRCHGW